MSVRAYLRSPIAIAWTFVAAIAVGAVAAAGWNVAVFLVSLPAVSDPAFLDGLGAIAVSLLVASAVSAVAAAVWLPCSAAIAYAVGRAVRNRSTTAGSTVGVVRHRSKPLYRWAKTRAAVGPIAEYILSETDVSPAEVAVGCDGFVVPALVLDAPTLPLAVDRANRVVPPAGRERILLAGVGTTIAFAVGVGAVGMTGGSSLPSTSIFVGVVVVVGAVLTAALDAAWRAGTYATQDLSDGFST